MPIDIRPLQPSEIETAKTLVPAGNAEPNWNDTLAVIQDGEVVCIFGAQKRLHAEPLYCKQGHHVAALLAFGHLDGIMRSLALHYGLAGYEFFVADNQPKFQLFAANNFPVTAGKEVPGITFFRSFEVPYRENS